MEVRKYSLALLISFLVPIVYIAQSDQVVLQEAQAMRALDGDSIEVRFPDGTMGKVRYGSISAPELDQCFGDKAQYYNDKLVAARTVWLERDPLDGDYRRDRNGRFLAYVYLDPNGTQMVNIMLVQSGAAKLDVRDVKDDVEETNFEVRYVKQLIDAQTRAAKARLGWWGECNKYVDSDLVIAVIKLWSKNEIVYIVNRGKEPINLSEGWKLTDKDRKHELDFRKFFAGIECLLLPEGLIRVHSGNDITPRKGQYTPCGQLEIDLYWTGSQVWDNGGDEACLEDPEGRIVYCYKYPPEWD